MQTYYTEKIQTWKDTFENNPAWENTTFKTLAHPKGTRPLNLLNVAKVLCDFFSDLAFSEQIEIQISDENTHNYVEKVLEVNGFWDSIPELLSTAFAFGGGAIKTYAENSEVKLSYVHADKFIPIEWTGSTITTAIFVSQTVKNGDYYNLIEKQSIGKSEFKLYKSDNNSSLGTECKDLSELYGDMPNVITYDNVSVPMFAYFKPCISNNAEYDTPLGMSIYANSMDTLEALDITFDSFAREVVLGKKRIIVPSEALKTVVSEGEVVRYFDTNDEAFVAFRTDDISKFQFTDNTSTLRIAEHVQAINALLNILCFQVGLSAGSLSFDAVQGTKTATEVISQDSKTARTIKSNKNLLVEMFETVVHAIVAQGNIINSQDASKGISKADYDVTISFKDNIIIDDNTMIDNNIKLVQSGLKSKLSAIMEVLKCDEETAQKELDRINSEQSVTGLAVDDLMGEGEAVGNVETIKDGETDDETGTNAN